MGRWGATRSRTRLAGPLLAAGLAMSTGAPAGGAAASTASTAGQEWPSYGADLANTRTVTGGWVSPPSPPQAASASTRTTDQDRMANLGRGRSALSRTKVTR